MAWRTVPRGLRQLSTQADTTQHLANMVRERDYAAYLTHIAYPRRLQPHFFALRAFYIELASLKDTLSNELNRPPKHPITLGLRDAIFDPAVAQHGSLVKDHFLRIIDAREADLADPLSPPTLAELEQYAESTSSRMLYLLLNLQGLSETRVDELFSHLGKAMGLCTLVASLPYHTHPAPRPRTGGGGAPGLPGSKYAPQAHGTPRTPTLPLPLDYLMEQRVVQEDVFRHGIHARGLRDAIFRTATRANDYLITVRTHIQDTFEGRVPSAAVAPLLLGVQTRLVLQKLEASDFNPYDAAVAQRSWLLPWHIWRAARTGRL
ncbi:hypothetical protein MCAP1_003564 [Malassezia caprae]|uniref:Uncharacterized protein n=1 Tax=Malassezia caprae TaxID=1381934 RepID=A0AAF0EBG9_9BASI|nr:hypothetical protein MCAP1_003564 [Malassezia caprae]